MVDQRGLGVELAAFQCGVDQLVAARSARSGARPGDQRQIYRLLRRGGRGRLKAPRLGARREAAAQQQTQQRQSVEAANENIGTYRTAHQVLLYIWAMAFWLLHRSIEL